MMPSEERKRMSRFQAATVLKRLRSSYPEPEYARSPEEREALIQIREAMDIAISELLGGAAG